MVEAVDVVPMNRRGFLRLLAATPAMPLVSKIPAGAAKPVVLDLAAFQDALREIYTPARIEALLWSRPFFPEALAAVTTERRIDE